MLFRRNIRHNILPEQALMRAVLEDAIRCCAGDVAHELSPWKSKARLRREALRWVRHHSQEPFEFDSICTALGLSPSYIRRGILARFGVAPEKAIEPPAVERATALLETGLSVTQVARALGLSLPHVSRITHQFARRRLEARNAEIRALRQRGATPGHLMRQYHLSYESIRRICRRHPAPRAA